MQLERFTKVHFVGVGGIGISAVAKMMKALGKEVSGSDVAENETIAELSGLGVKVFKGHAAENLAEDADLLVYSSAVPQDNPERKKARQINILELSYFEFLGELSSDYFCIAVAGTHGKSTTAAMLGKILVDAGVDPTVIIGSKLKTFEQNNFRLGKSKYLVIEACEYRANFLKLNPDILLITNIEAEHLDYYRDLEDVAMAFQRLVGKLPDDGPLIYNADDPASINHLQPRAETLSFGINNQASFEAHDIIVAPGKQTFNVLKNGEVFISKAELVIPGRFNIYNALGPIAAADLLGVEPETIKQSLKNFSGLWRRLEIIGSFNRATIISDYGHHPTEIAAAIAAVRDFYPGRRIVWVFQPHQHSRTKKLFNDFINSFAGVDVLLISDIFDVAGREATEDQDINSEFLASEISRLSPNTMVQYSGNLKKTEELLRQKIQPDDVVVIQGAGDIDDLARKITK